MTADYLCRDLMQTPPVAQLLGLSNGWIESEGATASYHAQYYDHIHLLIDLHPDNNISQLVKSLQSETSKMIQTEFEAQFNAVYYKTALWGRQKFIVSCGGAPLKIIQDYIKNQDSPPH